MNKIDGKILKIEKNEIILFSILRNESLRLPYFIEYYKKLGVDRLIFVDNGSTDDSHKIILKEESAHLFYTNESYENHWYWMEYLLEMYGKGNWCIVVDIDELFVYPDMERVNLPGLVSFLDEEGTYAIRAFLLDMYAKEDLQNIKYRIGENPIDYLQYFDVVYESIYFNFLDRKNNKSFSSPIFTGGMRERVFGKTQPPHILSKIPLFKNIEGSYLVQGMHAINGCKVSDLQGVVLHTKFLSDFINEVNEEVERAKHYGGGFYYKHYQTKFKKGQMLNLFFDNSEEYLNNEQLIKLGLMKITNKYREWTPLICDLKV